MRELQGTLNTLFSLYKSLQSPHWIGHTLTEVHLQVNVQRDRLADAEDLLKRHINEETAARNEFVKRFCKKSFSRHVYTLKTSFYYCEKHYRYVFELKRVKTKSLERFNDQSLL